MVPMKLLNRLYFPIGLILATGICFTSYTTQYTRTEAPMGALTEAAANMQQTEQAVYTRLQELDQQIEKNHENDKSATANARRAAAETERKLWQAELDRILDRLEERLSDQDWQKLAAEQNKWLITREEQAAPATTRNSSSTMEELEHQISLSESTRARAYELADTYSEWLTEEDAETTAEAE